MANEDIEPEQPEEFESLTSEEEERIKESFSTFERRIEQLELQEGEAFYALKNQKRLMYYLEDLKRILEENLDVDIPSPPSMEEPSEDRTSS
ncbi:MAG: hypothetical protein ABEK50_03005 [bacterium]